MPTVSEPVGHPATHPATGLAGGEERSTGRVMHIGEVAERTDLSLRSLRHWDEVGLLRPSGRSEGGFRLYTEEDVERILAVRRMKPLGFSLEEMKAAMRDIEALADPSTDRETRAASRARLTAVLEEAGGRRARLATQLAMADEFIDNLAGRLGSDED
jgi:DNA-binding transcriptional MerR regulator